MSEAPDRRMSTINETSGRGPADFEAALATAPAAGASFEEEHTGPMRRVQHFLHQYPTSVPFLVLILGIAAFTIPFPRYVDGELHFAALAGVRFFSAFNLSLILQQVTIIAVLGTAQTLVILTAGIDLSVGVIMILCSVVMGRTCVVYGVPLWIAFPLGLSVGLACGAVNGMIVTLLRLPPFIVTLGTWSIFGALNVWYSRSETIRQQDIEASAPFLQWTGTVIKPYDLILNNFGFEVGWLKGSVLTYGSLLMVLLAIAIWYMLNRTAFGRHVYATGDDPDAARLAGINTDRTLVAVYAMAGVICAVAAWVLIGRIGGVSPQAGQTANLDSITAVVIGGTSLFGGRGSIVGTLVGALIVGVFRNGLTLMGVSSVYQILVTGILVILAVATDQLSRRGGR
jgi:fructose transport system permease protein